jgi:hypothetical protein
MITPTISGVERYRKVPKKILLGAWRGPGGSSGAEAISRLIGVRVPTVEGIDVELHQYFRYICSNSDSFLYLIEYYVIRFQRIFYYVSVNK